MGAVLLFTGYLLTAQLPLLPSIEGSAHAASNRDRLSLAASAQGIPTGIRHVAAPPTTTTVPTTAPPPRSISTAPPSAETASRTTTAHAAPATPSGCPAALAYLAAHAAPGFRFVCPGYAYGHQAMTCVNVAGMCPNEELIVIAVACPASWMNEANNSWVLTGRSSGPIDPYGYCH